MSNPTSNFNWQMPTATDLVTDLPADFEVFGQAVDTSLADLKGGTTGQLLSKATGTDMDFTWTNPVSSGFSVVKSETSFSAITEIIADSVFSTTYSDYLLQMYWTSSSTSLLLMNLRAGGVNTTTNYNDQVTEALASSIGTSYVTQPYVAHAINGSFYGSMRLNLFSPNKAEVTNFQSDSVVPSGGYAAPKITQMYGFQTDSTQFTGIRLYVGNGNITGRYTIYGKAK
jgi:hypothetical protein